MSRRVCIETRRDAGFFCIFKLFWSSFWVAFILFLSFFVFFFGVLSSFFGALSLMGLALVSGARDVTQVYSVQTEEVELGNNKNDRIAK